MLPHKACHTCSVCVSSLTLSCDHMWSVVAPRPPGTLTTEPRSSLCSVKEWIGEMEQLSWGVLGRGRAHSKLRHHSKEQLVTSLGPISLGPLSHFISPTILSSPAALSLLLSRLRPGHPVVRSSGAQATVGRTSTEVHTF